MMLKAMTNTIALNKKSIMQMKATDALYLSGLYLLCFARILSWSSLNSISFCNVIINGFEILALGLLVIRLLASSSLFNIKEILFFLIFIACLAASSWFSKNLMSLAIILLVIGAKDMDVMVLCKVMLYASIMSVSLVVILSVTGLLNDSDVVYKRNVFTGLVTGRNALGFSGPNDCGRALASIVFIYICAYFERLSVRNYLGLLAIAAFIALYIVSYNAAILVLLATIGVFLVKRISFESSTKFLVGIIILSILLGFLLPAIYDSHNQILVDIDNIASKRLYWTHWCIERYPVTLFGQEIHTVSFERASLIGQEAFFLDNTYYRLLLNYGLIPTLLYLIAFSASTFRCVRYRRVEILVILAVTLFGGLSNQWPIILFTCFPLLALTARLD